MCRSSAAWLHGVDARPSGAHLTLPVLECAVPRGTTPVRRPGLTCYVADLRQDDVEEVFGVPCTTSARTACDLARWSGPGRAIVTLDAMTRAGLIDPDELLVEIERWHGDRFVDRARHLLAAVDPGGEYDGEEYHPGRAAEAHDRHRRERIEREWGWNVLVVGKALVLGPSMALEYAVGEILGMEPCIRRRAW